MQAVERNEHGVIITDSQGNKELFDQAVFACHADQALAMLTNPSASEKRILGSFQYQNNRMVLHSDESFMPKKKNAWASWVYLSNTQKDKSSTVSLSYWMNQLQPLATNTPMIVTLNPGREPNKELIHDEYLFEHIRNSPGAPDYSITNSGWPYSTGFASLINILVMVPDRSAGALDRGL